MEQKKHYNNQLKYRQDKHFTSYENGKTSIEKQIRSTKTVFLSESQAKLHNAHSKNTGVYYTLIEDVVDDAPKRGRKPKADSIETIED